MPDDSSVGANATPNEAAMTSMTSPPRFENLGGEAPLVIELIAIEPKFFFEFACSLRSLYHRSYFRRLELRRPAGFDSFELRDPNDADSSPACDVLGAVRTTTDLSMPARTTLV